MKLTKTLRYCCQTIKQKLIQGTLIHVKSYGWTPRAVIAACLDNNLSPASQGIISLYEVISHATRKWNEEALATLGSTNFNNTQGIRNRVSLSIKTRLSLQIPFISHWHEAMAIGAHPSNLPTTTSILWAYADAIWRLCGDTSTDYNYYTKRTLFNTAYVSTQLFMLSDQTSDYKATWEFLDRRLEDILAAGKYARQAGQVAGAIGKGLFSLTGLLKPYPEHVDHPIQRMQSQTQETSKQPTKNDKERQNPSKS